MRASELFAILARLDDVYCDHGSGPRPETIDESCQTVDMVLDSIPGARAFMEEHALQIALCGPNGKLEFVDRELSN